MPGNESNMNDPPSCACPDCLHCSNARDMGIQCVCGKPHSADWNPCYKPKKTMEDLSLDKLLDKLLCEHAELLELSILTLTRKGEALEVVQRKMKESEARSQLIRAEIHQRQLGA